MIKRFCKGLSLIDLVIIATLVIVMSGVIYSRYDDFACRSMQSEAKFALAHIYAAQKHYHSEHDHFASLETLLLDEQRAIVPERYFSFSEAEAPTKDTFRIQAHGLQGTLVAKDIWLVDENNHIVNQQNGCVK